MQQPQMSPYPVSDFLQWKGSEQLVITPKFQRRDVWNPKAKSYLIDSIIRGMPIPPVFLRLQTQTNPPKTLREVVDGQQRLKCVIDYIGGAFELLRVHNREYGGSHFDDLPEEIKADILAYKFQVNTLENLTDAEVLRIFARLNTYTEKLKAQELLNAEFFGAFKQTVYEISLDHYTFWTGQKIFTDQKIARMAEAEFVSELMISIVSGIGPTKASQIRSYYARFDDDFPQAEEIKTRFANVLDIIGEAYGNELARSPFRRLPYFYSLFLVVYDHVYGIPTLNARNQPVQPGRRRARAVNSARLRRRLNELRNEMADEDPDRAVAQFVESGAKATADPGRRRARHAFLTERLFA